MTIKDALDLYNIKEQHDADGDVNYTLQDGTCLEARDVERLASEEMILNSCDKLIWTESAVMMMDDDIRERLHSELAPCTEKAFFDAYAVAHAAKYGETWEFDTPNPSI